MQLGIELLQIDGHRGDQDAYRAARCHYLEAVRANVRREEAGIRQVAVAHPLHEVVLERLDRLFRWQSFENDNGVGDILPGENRALLVRADEAELLELLNRVANIVVVLHQIGITAASNAAGLMISSSMIVDSCVTRAVTSCCSCAVGVKS